MGYMAGRGWGGALGRRPGPLPVTFWGFYNRFPKPGRVSKSSREPLKKTSLPGTTDSRAQASVIDLFTYLELWWKKNI